MAPAVLTFSFDPVVQLTPTASVRLETVALAGAIFVALLLTLVIARRTLADGPWVPPPRLRADDLLFVVIGAVPGAVVGGRLGYVLDHLEYYRDHTAAMTDFGQGGLGLTLAVPFGILTGALIARLIGAPVARWLHVAALPLLVGLTLGKLAEVLGGTGQGLPSDLPWATAYAGSGPWGSLAPAIASQPAQAYEGLLGIVAILVYLAASRLDVVARKDGGALFLALALWAVVRFGVAFTWRDTVDLGPLRVDQVVALLLFGLSVIGLVERSRAAAHAPDPSRELRPEPAE